MSGIKVKVVFLSVLCVVRLAAGKCPDGQFPCEGDRCLLNEYKCNGRVDCPDKSDEQVCTKIHCNKSSDNPWILCDNGYVCIRQSQICDGVDQCGDEWDEKFCPWSCALFEFRCIYNETETAKCIPAHQKCDGRNDCGNYYDELDCGQCESFEFKCATTPKCVSFSQVCDGNDNCGDGSDELNCKETEQSRDKKEPSKGIRLPAAIKALLVATLSIGILVLCGCCIACCRRRNEQKQSATRRSMATVQL